MKKKTVKKVKREQIEVVPIPKAKIEPLQDMSMTALANKLEEVIDYINNS